MELIPSNASIFSPRGFRPVVPDPGALVGVTAGSVWGSDDLARLRTAGLVRVQPVAGGGSTHGRSSARTGWMRPGSALTPDDLALRTVLWLALAGVPVSGEGLGPTVRARIPQELLDVLDSVQPTSVADAGRREELSMRLRRCARVLTYRRALGAPATVAVLLPDGDLPESLRHDLEAQDWPATLRFPVRHQEDAVEVVARARDGGALYCTRMSGEVRYGPHHLADLVDALSHSGARAAHSPPRFRPWHGGGWLEDEGLGMEGATREVLPGGSMWYAVDGPEAPHSPDDYAVHGANAVPMAPLAQARPAALRLHRSKPIVLDWLDEASGGLTGDAVTIPRSYFAATGAPSRARSA